MTQPNRNGYDNRRALAPQNAAPVTRPQETQLAQQVKTGEIDPEIVNIARLVFNQAQADGTVLTPEKAIAAAFQVLRAQERGEELGRDVYLGTQGNVAGQVIDGYQGLQKRIGRDFQTRYRSLSAEERADRDLNDGDKALACELEVYDMMRQARELGIPYRPPTGYCILRKAAQQPRLPAMRDLRWWMEKVARKDALRQVPGLPQTVDDILDEAALEIEGFQYPPDGARLTLHQARAWVDRQHKLMLDRHNPQGAQERAQQSQGLYDRNHLSNEFADWRLSMAPCPYCKAPSESPAHMHGPDCKFRALAPAALLAQADAAEEENQDAGPFAEVRAFLNSNPACSVVEGERRKWANGCLRLLFGVNTELQAEFVRWAFGAQNADALTSAQCAGIIEFVKPAKVGNEYVPDDKAIQFAGEFRAHLEGADDADAFGDEEEDMG